MENELLANIKAKLPELERLLQEMDSHWEYEDLIYRFYHHSFKVDNKSLPARERGLKRVVIIRRYEVGRSLPARSTSEVQLLLNLF